LTTSAQSKKSKQKDHFLIAIAAGINQKKSVDAIMKKKILQLYCSITTGMSMGGMIYHGAKV